MATESLSRPESLPKTGFPATQAYITRLYKALQPI
jgi:hypothetical protein